MKNTAYYIKTLTLTVLLFIESLFLTTILLEYVRAQDFFTPPAQTIAQISVLMLLIAYTQALTIGAWDTWQQFLIVPIPIGLGILLITFPVDPLYAFAAFLVASLIITQFTLRSTTFKNLFTKFKPHIILKHTIKGTFLAITVTTALLVIINPSAREPLDIGNKVGEIANEQVQKIAQSDAVIQPLLQMGKINLDVKDQVAQKVNDLVAPYRRLFTPLMAVVVFSLMHGLSMIVFTIFLLSIRLIFIIAKKTKFLNVDYVDVKQETLKF